MSASTLEISLDCQPGKEGEFLIFPYQLRNLSPVSVYVMEATGRIEDGGALIADRGSAVVMHGPGEDVTIGRIAAPLPVDRRIAVPVVPLARLLAPGAALDGRVQVSVPLAETSPYFADLPLRRYEMTEVSSVVFCVGYWAAGADGVSVLAADYAPGLFMLTARNTARSARLVSSRFRTRPMQLFRRTGQFPRPGGG
jgi:hypothetical protein